MFDVVVSYARSTAKTAEAKRLVESARARS